MALVSPSNQIPRNEWPSITDFYTNKDVFITGATGFMGKCLLEKLLRSIPGKGKIFVLVRQKKGKSSQERVQDLTSTKVSCAIGKGIQECVMLSVLLFPYKVSPIITTNTQLTGCCISCNDLRSSNNVEQRKMCACVCVVHSVWCTVYRVYFDS